MEIRPRRRSTTGWSRGTRTDLVVGFLVDGRSAVGGKRVSGSHIVGDGVRQGANAGRQQKRGGVVGADKTEQE